MIIRCKFCNKTTKHKSISYLVSKSSDISICDVCISNVLDKDLTCQFCDEKKLDNNFMLVSKSGGIMCNRCIDEASRAINDRIIYRSKQHIQKIAKDPGLKFTDEQIAEYKLKFFS